MLCRGWKQADVTEWPVEGGGERLVCGHKLKSGSEQWPDHLTSVPTAEFSLEQTHNHGEESHLKFMITDLQRTQHYWRSHYIFQRIPYLRFVQTSNTYFLTEKVRKCWGRCFLFHGENENHQKRRSLVPTAASTRLRRLLSCPSGRTFRAPTEGYSLHFALIPRPLTSLTYPNTGPTAPCLPYFFLFLSSPVTFQPAWVWRLLPGIQSNSQKPLMATKLTEIWPWCFCDFSPPLPSLSLLLQPHWPLRHSFNLTYTFPPQSLCTSIPVLTCLPPDLHVTHLLLSLFKWYPVYSKPRYPVIHCLLRWLFFSPFKSIIHWNTVCFIYSYSVWSALTYSTRIEVLWELDISLKHLVSWVLFDFVLLLLYPHNGEKPGIYRDSLNVCWIEGMQGLSLTKSCLEGIFQAEGTARTTGPTKTKSWVCLRKPTKTSMAQAEEEGAGGFSILPPDCCLACPRAPLPPLGKASSYWVLNELYISWKVKWNGVTYVKGFYSATRRPWRGWAFRTSLLREPWTYS